MRTRSTVGLLTLFAALASSALIATAAFASPEWYVKKSGTFTKASTAIKVEFEGTNVGLLETERAGNHIGFTCGGNWGSGTVESGGLGKIEHFQAEVRSCKGITEGKESGPYLCAKEPSLTMEALDLSWKTELVKEGSEIRAKIADGSSEKTPGFTFTCKNFLGTKSTARCNANTSTHMTNNTSAGLVEAEFEAKSAKTECAEKGTGEWKGVLKIKPTKAEKEAGVEAIKVE
jgi:hypothetical protein